MSSAPAMLAAVAVLVAGAPGRRPPRRVRQWLDGERGSSQVGGLSPARLGRVTAVGARAVAWLAVVGHVPRAVAGLPADPGRDGRLGAALAAGALMATVAPALALPVMGVVYGVPAIRARSRDSRRRARLAADAPDLVELFRLAVGAGLTIGQALTAVTARAPLAWAGPLGDVADRVAVGQRLADALEGLGAVDESARPLSAALVAAERYGVSVGVTLERLAHDARQQRRRRAEEVARRLPVQMLFPLVLCVLPAFALLTVVPLVVTAVGGLPR